MKCIDNSCISFAIVPDNNERAREREISLTYQGQCNSVESPISDQSPETSSTGPLTKSPNFILLVKLYLGLIADEPDPSDVSNMNKIVNEPRDV